MDFLLMSGEDRRAISAAGLSPLHVEPLCLQQFVPRLYPAPFSRAEARNAPRVCSRFVRVRAGACFCAMRRFSSLIWNDQTSLLVPCLAQKQARPEGLRGKCRHAALRNLARERPLPASRALRNAARPGDICRSNAECDETGTDPNSLPGETPCGIRWVSGRHACGNNG